MSKIWTSLKNLVKSDEDEARRKFVETKEVSETPWASFEVAGFEDDGQVKIEFNWNKAFIQKIEELGFQAETEEDSVQLFFYTSQMRPTALVGDDPVQPDGMPTLSAQQNLVR